MKIVSIGGYGHSVLVFNEIIETDNANLVAFAPAYNGEDLSIVTSHKIINDDVKYYDDYKKMLDIEKPDVAVVSSRLDKNAEVSINAANKGCHLICEKPLAINHNDLIELYNTVKKNNVKFMAMLSMRAEPAFIKAREIYKTGEIGEAILINARKSYKWGNRPEWFGDKEKYGSTIAWIGIHALDVINFITDLKFTSVAAMKGNFAHLERKDCDDNCVIILELSNGGHATASIDFLRSKEANSHGDDWVRIVGTNGLIEVSGESNSYKLINENGEITKIIDKNLNKIYKKFLMNIENNIKQEIPMYIPFMLTDICLLANDAANDKKIKMIDSESKIR